MFKRFKVTGINENPKKPKRNLMKYLALGCVMALPAFALLKTGVLSMNKNVLAADKNKYDIVADLDGGKFEMGTTPEFTKMDNGNWLYKYKPVPTSIKLPVPVKDGYEFTGWSVSAKPDIQKEYSIPAWHKGNLNVKANWKILDANLMTGLEFNSKVKAIEGFGGVTEIRFEKGETSLDGIGLANGSDQNIIKGYINGNVLHISSQSDIKANSDCSGMFAGFSNVASINFNNFSTLKTTDMHNMFNGCKNLTTIDVSKWNTSQVTDMYQMFYECSSLKTVDVSKWDTSQVIDMHNMFGVCSSLTYINVANWNTSKVTNICGMFNDCLELTTIDVSKWNTSQVTDMHNIFNGCIRLETVDVSKWDTSQVTDMRGIFNNCSNLSVIDVSDWDTSKVIDMDNLFNKCSSLITVDVSKWNTSQVTDMHNMFSKCSKLTTIGVNDWNISKVTDMSDIFNGCLKLSGDITISNLNIALYNRMFMECSTDPNAKFIVKYKDAATKEIAKNMVATKSINSNVFLYELPTLMTGREFNRTINAIPGFNDVTEIQFIKGVPNSSGVNVAVRGDAKAHIEGTILKIVSGDEIFANEDCSFMFSEIGRGYSPNNILNKIVFKNFNTSKVTNMDFMFTSCQALTDIDVSSFNTGSVISMNGVFSYCNSLSSLDLSRWDVKEVTTMDSLVKGCSVLESLILGNLNTSKVTSMGSMFSSCYGLSFIDVSGLDTSSVTDMNYMFYDCSSLTNLDVSSFDTSNVTSMTSMFDSCSSLTELNISGFNTSNVDNMRSMFSGCKYLSHIKTDTFDMRNVTSTEYMFSDCRNLNGEITIASNVHTYDDMFRNCSTDNKSKFLVGFSSAEFEEVAKNLVGTKSSNSNVILNSSKTVLLRGWSFNNKLTSMDGFKDVTEIRFVKQTPDPNGVNVAEYGEAMASISGNVLTIASDKEIFTNKDCSNMFRGFGDSFEINKVLSKITFNNFNTSGTTDMSYMFDQCESLTSLDVSGFDTGNVRVMYDMFSECKALANIDVSGFNTSNVTRMSNLFYNCLSLSSVDVRNFDTSNVTHMNGLFHGCNSLSSIDVSGFDTSNVTNMGDLFRDCFALKSINIRNFDTRNVTNMHCLFADCKLLTNIDVSNFDTSNVTNIGAMFSGCESLTSIDISNFDTRKVENCYQLFGGCSNLTHLDLSNFDTSKVTTMRYMFSACSKLKSLNISSFDTSSVRNMEYMFAYCDALESINLSHFKTSSATDMNHMFYDCDLLKSINISSFDTSNVTDMSFMFGYCPILSNLDLSALNTGKVTDMAGMFRGCKRLNGSITIANVYTRSYNYMFDGCSTENSSKFVVNYTSDETKARANAMIGTKSYYSNVVLGVQKPIVSANDMKTIVKYSPTTYAAAHQNMKPAAITRKINITLNNGSMAIYPIQKIQMSVGKIGDLAKPDLNPKYAGQFGGYFYDKNCTIPVKPNDVVTQDIELYAKW